MYFDYDPKDDRSWLIWGRIGLTVILSGFVYYLARTYLSYDEFEVYLFIMTATVIYYHRFAKMESGICSVCEQEIVFLESQEYRYRNDVPQEEE